MKKRFYIGLIVLAVLLLALGRLIVRAPVGMLGTRRRRAPGLRPRAFYPSFYPPQLIGVGSGERGALTQTDLTRTS
jgi:hypothetical protein